MWIVDYMHDETTSPKFEEGEIVSTDQTIFGQYFHVEDGVLWERSLYGTIQARIIKKRAKEETILKKVDNEI
jgi:hypothetical protein